MNVFNCLRLKIAGILLALIMTSLPAAALTIGMKGGEEAPIPIAILDFADNAGNEVLGREIATVVRNDLEHSGLFSLVSKTAFLKDGTSTKDGASTFENPPFADWRIVNAHCLLTGRIVQSSGSLTVELRLFDIYAGTQMLGISLTAREGQWRKIAHLIADAVYQRITDVAGYFDTKIAYIDESGSRSKRRVRRLAIMDWDGHNNVYLTDGTYMAFMPQFSPTSHEIAYLAYLNKSAHVYIMNVHTRKKRLMGNFEGMTFTPCFSPDGRTLLMSLAKGGTTAIYKMDLASSTVVPLTEHLCIDTSPCFSPDGTQIAFTSDRPLVRDPPPPWSTQIAFTSDRSDSNACQEQIYIMDADGRNVRKISEGEGKYSQPAWSPRGDLIAFTKQVQGQFYIGLMNVDGTNERLIAAGYLVEAPTWSPNGHVILFTKESGGRRGSSRLYAIDVTGHNLRLIKTPRDASDGSWSRLLSP